MFCIDANNARCSRCFHQVSETKITPVRRKDLYFGTIKYCLPNKIDIPTSRFPNAGCQINDPNNSVCGGFLERR